MKLCKMLLVIVLGACVVARAEQTNFTVTVAAATNATPTVVQSPTGVFVSLIVQVNGSVRVAIDENATTSSPLCSSNSVFGFNYNDRIASISFRGTSNNPTDTIKVWGKW